MNVKKQHYVWREYLRNFCFKPDTIFSKINGNKIVPNNLMNVAQEKYFYKIHNIENEEYQYLNEFLDTFIKEDNGIKEYLKTILITLLISNNQEKNETITNFKNNFFEDLITKNEALGKKIISIKNLSEIKDCFNSKELHKNILFLIIQLVRTKRQKNRILKEFKNNKIDFEKIWFFISFSIGNIVAYNIIKDRKIKISLLSNVTNYEFITSDQPVVNISNASTKGKNSNYFKLYFPIAPHRALLFDFDSKSYSFEEKHITEKSYIETLNKTIAENSEMFIFSKQKQFLEI